MLKHKIISLVLTCVLLIAMLPAIPFSAQAAQIPDDAVSFQGHRYMRYELAMTWTEAQHYCERLGGHLATITSEEEQNTIAALISLGQRNAYWLGANRLSGSWEWITGEPMVYTHWHEDQPDGSGDYMDLFGPAQTEWTSTYWDDTGDAGDDTGGFTSEVIGFVCEWEEAEPAPALSDEIIHLIFSDMAYARIPASFKNSGKTVAQWLLEKTYLEIPEGEPGYDEEEMTQPIFEQSDMNRLQVYQMLGDWIIADVIDGEAGYAANVFRKGNDVIIAYRGSEGGPASMFTTDADWRVDMRFALLNQLDGRQFNAALETYRTYANTGNVTLTGHSLGGALVTYVSTLTGARGYSFDGAAGHVIDLTYLFEPQAIDFHSMDQMPFVNITDPPSVPTFGADLIQHTNETLLPGICYQTNPQAIPYYSTLFWTHQQYSNTRPSADGTLLEFMPITERHQPANPWYASVDYSFLGIATGGICGVLVGLVTGGLPGAIGIGGSGGLLLGALGRMVKVGNVHLGTAGNDVISALTGVQSVLDLTAVITENVIYGGDGVDSLVGAASGDVLIPGSLEGDWLAGGLGSDVYLLDAGQPGTVYLSDTIGQDVIRLHNAGSLTVGAIAPTGYDAASKSYGFSLDGGCTVYLRKTLFRHRFQILAEDGTPLCRIDTKGGMDLRAPVQAEEAPDCKEITVEGRCEVDVFAPDGALAATYSTLSPGLFSEEFGTVFVCSGDEQPVLTATLYDSYTLKVRGDSTVDTVIVGTETDHYVNEVRRVAQVNLRVADAEITPKTYTVRQDGKTLPAKKAEKTVSVSVSSQEQMLSLNASTLLHARAQFADQTSTDRVYWISGNPEIATCEAGENGTCTVTAVGVGETELYAVAEDSGLYAVCRVTVTEAAPEPLPFQDVSENQYYYDAVCWAYRHNPRITSGTDATHFSPKKTCTRAEVVTFLWAAEEKPDADWSSNPFADVKKSKYYFKPVLWAFQNGVTKGADETHFNPNGDCTRAQVVTFLWALQGKPEPVGRNPFADVGAKDWYCKAVLWAYEKGITKGTDATHFSPTKPCTRAEVVTFLYKAFGGSPKSAPLPHGNYFTFMGTFPF